MEKIAVSIEYLRRVEHALVSLKQYIDQAPTNGPLLWIGDMKTPIRNMPDYHYAAEALSETTAHILAALKQ